MPKKNFWNKMDHSSIARARQISRRAATERAQQIGKKGKGGFWDNEIRIMAPKKDETTGELLVPQTEVIRLVPGNYKVPNHVEEETECLYSGNMPRYVHMEYYHPNRGRRGKQVPDTRDWHDGRDISRYLVDQGDESIGMRMMTYHSILHLGHWHLTKKTIEVKDRETGNPKDIQVDEWAPCTGGRHCDHCKNDNPSIMGRPGYICNSPSIQESLDSLEHVVAMFCRCGCVIPLQVNQAFCANPECKYVFEEIEFDQNGDLARSIGPKDIGRMYDDHAICPECKLPLVEYETEGETTYIEENLQCMNCGSPSRACLYDADLALHKVGLGPKVQLELDQQVFAQFQRGFRIREVPEELAERAVLFDFNDGLKNSLGAIAKRLDLKEDENPYAKEEGYKPRPNPKRRSDRYS